MALIRLFAIFFRIGALTFGGGYAMIPVIEKELVDRYKLIDRSGFYDALIICQSLPGVIAINFAVFLGYKIKGAKGAFASALGVALPSFMIIILVAVFFFSSIDNPYVERAFRGIRISVVVLIATAGYRVYKQNKEWPKLLIALGTFTMVALLNLSPFVVILLIAFLALFYGRLKEVLTRDTP